MGKKSSKHRHGFTNAYFLFCEILRVTFLLRLNAWYHSSRLWFMQHYFRHASCINTLKRSPQVSPDLLESIESGKAFVHPKIFHIPLKHWIFNWRWPRFGKECESIRIPRRTKHDRSYMSQYHRDMEKRSSTPTTFNMLAREYRCLNKPLCWH